MVGHRVCVGLLVAVSVVSTVPAAAGSPAAVPPRIRPPAAATPGGAPGAAVSCAVLWDSSLGMPTTGGTSVAMGDLDADGLPEIIVSRLTRDGPAFLAAFDGTTGKALWRADFEAWVSSALVDLVGDPAPEVVAACGEDLAVLDARTGARLRSTRLSAPVGTLAAGRFGPAGPALVYTAGAKVNDRLVALRGSDLAELWTLEAGPSHGRFADGFSKLAVRDLGGDGVDEILVAEHMNTLECLASDGRVLWRSVLGEMTRLVPAGGASCDPVAQDLVPGSGAEVAVGCFGGALAVLDGEDGEILTSARFGVESHEGALSRRGLPRFIRDAIATLGEPIMDIVAANVDAHPGNELVFGCADGFVYAADPRTGARLWRFDAPGDVTDRPLPVDADGDGAADVIVWDQKGIYLLDGRTGVVMPGLPAVLDIAGVLAGDVNGDARLDLVAVTYKSARIMAWSTGIPCGRGAILGGDE
jgi:outer membrane protein assembly factor BamB